MQSFLHRVANLLYQPLAITFFFVKSDIKTVMIPCTSFAIAAAPISGLDRLPHVVFWLFLIIIYFDVSNQIRQPEEDRLNKPYRPIPSGLISISNAILLKRILLPLSLGISLLYSPEVFAAAVGFTVITYFYDEKSGSASHFVVRTLWNIGGYFTLNAGAALVAAGGDCRTLDHTAIVALCCNVGIVLTTIHSQDFKDEHGDRVVGRKTVPILHPSIARYTLLPPMLFWSGVLSMIWHLDILTASAYQSLAVFVGSRYIRYKSVPEDQISYYWFNLWFSISNVLSGYYRLYGRVR
ncbi:hypothetical protein BV25DRAFT_1040905 [Artomyces pyxidatus]|uniref:Uncharacterized protein n=1 Tax=Artomyces pyxidatus TaxID=48021 RepID=A0ACB8SU23_9AGAM|nr:hypothetical protein BV25DRAFT_1040905 [Artomyces pyxidatus]